MLLLRRSVILSHRYGADELSITEIKYGEALKRGIPVFIFIISDEHPVKRQDVESVAKLTALVVTDWKVPKSKS